MKELFINKHIQKIIIIITICLLTSMPGQTVHADEAKTVKVAYVLQNGFQEGKQGEYKTGWGYEYLQRIANYTGWKYEYVYGSFDELLTMLENGEADIMGDLSFTKEREEKILFSAEKQGDESVDLYINDNFEINAEDLSTLNNLSIGIIKSTCLGIEFNKWCEEHDIRCNVVYYENSDDMYNDFRKGCISAFVGSNVVNMGIETEGWQKLLHIGTNSFYFGVSKSREDILAELNAAQKRILEDDPYYNEKLMISYTKGKMIGNTQISENVKNWIKEHDYTIRIAYRDELLPYSDIDSDGNAKGMLVDFINQIENLYPDLNLTFETKGYETYDEMIFALKENEADVLFPVFGSYWNADQEGYYQTIPFTSSSTVLIYISEFDLKNAHIGYIRGNSYIHELQTSFNISDMTEYGSDEEALKALKKGEINTFVLASHEFGKVKASNPEYDDIKTIELPVNVSVSIAVGKDNRELISFLDGCISNIGDIYITGSLLKNSQEVQKMSLILYIKSNPLVLILLVISGIALILFIIFVRISFNSKRKIIEQTEYIAKHDYLTGLYNRTGLEETIKAMDKSCDLAAVMLIDIDDFKMINDTYGHTVGDKVLQRTAKILNSCFGDKGTVCRFGGDEFLCILPGYCADNQLEIYRMIDSANQEASKSSKGIPDITFSIGGIFSSVHNFEKVYLLADNALYQAKIQGKYGCVFLLNSDSTV